MAAKRPAGLIRIGELAKATHTNVSTIKYYVSQGLVDIAHKTSANMAYYNRSSIERILLIKKLQKERFYPLSLIKQLLDTYGSEEGMGDELELMDAIYKLPSALASRSWTSVSKAPGETGLTEMQVQKFIESGIISPIETSQWPVLSGADITILDLTKRRLEAGMSFEQSLATFDVYARNLRTAAEADIQAMVSISLLPGHHTSEELVRMIRVSDATLDEFVRIKRDQFNRLVGASLLDTLRQFLDRLHSYVDEFLPELPVDGEVSAVGPVGLVLRLFRLRHDTSVAALLPVLHETNECFRTMKVSEVMDPDVRCLLATLRLGYVTFAPEILGCKGEFHQAYEEAKSYCSNVSRIGEYLQGQGVLL